MDKGGSYTAILIDLSKAFDCIVHDYPIAKVSIWFLLRSPESYYVRLLHRQKAEIKSIIISVILSIYSQVSHKVQF